MRKQSADRYCFRVSLKLLSLSVALMALKYKYQSKELTSQGYLEVLKSQKQQSNTAWWRNFEPVLSEDKESVLFLCLLCKQQFASTNMFSNH